MTQVNGTPVLVRDLGRTTLSHQEREGILGKDRNPDTIEGIVLMLKYQNPSRTLRGLHEKVAQLNSQLAADWAGWLRGRLIFRTARRRICGTLSNSMTSVFRSGLLKRKNRIW